MRSIFIPKMMGISIFAFWAVTMSILIKEEKLFQRRSPPAGYRAIFSNSPAYSQWWMGIYFNEEKVGYTCNTFSSYEEDEEMRYRINSEAILLLPILGKDHRIHLSGFSTLNGNYQLRDFNFHLKSGTHEVGVEGETCEDSLLVRMDIAGEKVRRIIPLRKDILLYNSLSSFLARPNLRPGDRYSLDIIDPISLQPDEIEVRVMREDIPSPEQRRFMQADPGGRMRILVLETEYKGMTITSWVTPDGEVLREESSLGWVMKAETREEALTFRD